MIKLDQIKTFCGYWGIFTSNPAVYRIIKINYECITLRGQSIFTLLSWYCD